MKRFWKWLKREPIVIERVVEVVRYIDPAEAKRRIMVAAPAQQDVRLGFRRFWDEVDSRECCRYCCRCRR